MIPVGSTGADVGDGRPHETALGNDDIVPDDLHPEPPLVIDESTAGLDTEGHPIGRVAGGDLDSDRQVKGLREVRRRYGAGDVYAIPRRSRIPTRSVSPLG